MASNVTAAEAFLKEWFVFSRGAGKTNVFEKFSKEGDLNKNSFPCYQALIKLDPAIVKRVFAKTIEEAAEKGDRLDASKEREVHDYLVKTIYRPCLVHDVVKKWIEENKTSAEAGDSKSSRA